MIINKKRTTSRKITKKRIIGKKMILKKFTALITMVWLMNGTTEAMKTKSKQDSFGTEIILQQETTDDENVEGVTKESFYHEIQDSREDGNDMFLVLYAESCPHCMAFLPKIEALSEKIKLREPHIKIKFYKADLAKYPQFMKLFKTDQTPHTIYFHRGLPFLPMPPPMTATREKTEKWIRETYHKFKNFDMHSILKGTSIRSEQELFDFFMRMTRRHLFGKKKRRDGHQEEEDQEHPQEQEEDGHEEEDSKNKED